MSKPRLAVIGVGHLGKEHARVLAGLPDVDLVGVVDQRPEQAQTVALRCRCRHFISAHEVLDQIDAAVIAVPTTHHHEVARECLEHGISLLIEKPIAATVEQANELVALAQEQRLVLQIGHVERFNPALERMQQRPIQPKLVNARRLSPYTGRSTDIGVVLDLMIHDLDVILTLVKSPIRSVSALGVQIHGGHEDLAQAHLTFENGCVAHLQASRAHHEPVRLMDVWSPEGLIQIDFHRRSLSMVQPERKAPTGFEHGFGTSAQSLHEQCDYGPPDQLTRELRDFVDALQRRCMPRVSGEQGRNALVLAQHVLNSLQKHKWNGIHPGPAGPHELPAPLGPLFIPRNRTAA